MINPLDANHRARLAKALDFSYQELQKFGRMRSITVQAYLGYKPEIADGFWALNSATKYKKSLPMGNLLQLSALSHQIALAYGEPKVIVKARTPENAGLATTLGPALNRMAALLDLGETHRQVAADSYFGYGIYKCGIGYLPESARIATGLDIGPCIWRVGQPNFIYDIKAETWSRVGYVGDVYDMSQDEAIRQYPKHADRLRAFTDHDSLDAPRVFPRPSRMYAAEEDVWLFDCYLPGSKTIATWPIRNGSFSTVADEPLAVRDYDGHWSGIYQVETHLYSPDELVPIAQAESVKAMHFLFNDLLHLTSEQARNAKYNPLFRAANQKDMDRVWKAKDRYPVSVTDPQQLQGAFQVPGPTPTQQNYLLATMNLFREMTPTYDEPQRAPTATQGTLERQTTNAIIAEARRKDTRCLQLVYYKLGHMLLNDQEIILPGSRPLRPGSNIPLDVTYAPGPRQGKIDDFDISIEPFSTVYRSPQEKIGQLVQSAEIISNAMMLKLQGADINVERVINTLAEYQDLPELLEWYEPADPLAQAKRASSQQSVPRIGAGHHYRHNVSERSNAGALEMALNQQPAENGVHVSPS